MTDVGEPWTTNYTRICKVCGKPIHTGDVAMAEADGWTHIQCVVNRQNYVAGPTEFKEAQLNPIPRITRTEIERAIDKAKEDWGP